MGKEENNKLVQKSSFRQVDTEAGTLRQHSQWWVWMEPAWEDSTRSGLDHLSPGQPNLLCPLVPKEIAHMDALIQSDNPSESGTPGAPPILCARALPE